MKLSKKIKKEDARNHDFVVQLVSILFTAAWVVGVWWPVEKPNLLTGSVLFAVTFAGATIIWMVATAFSRIANYTYITVILAVFSGLFAIGPKVVCENFIDGWKIQSSGMTGFLISEAVIAVCIGLITSGLRSKK